MISFLLGLMIGIVVGIFLAIITAVLSLGTIANNDNKGDYEFGNEQNKRTE